MVGCGSQEEENKEKQREQARLPDPELNKLAVLILD
jgi:hypothetical protein